MKLYLLLTLMSCTLTIRKEHRNIVGKTVVDMDLCSGVFISPTKILTADHCVEGAQRVWIKTADDKHFTAVVLKTDKAKDLGLISIVVPYYPYATLGANAEITDKVITVNSGEGLEKTYGEGVVENIMLYADSDPTKTILTSIQIMLGASGSGLFNKDGKLIGILVAKVAAGSLAVNTSDIRDFIKDE